MGIDSDCQFIYIVAEKWAADQGVSECASEAIGFKVNSGVKHFRHGKMKLAVREGTGCKGAKRDLGKYKTPDVIWKPLKG
jgi:hypothetical protein